jgi:hypothetical protein
MAHCAAAAWWKPLQAAIDPPLPLREPVRPAIALAAVVGGSIAG